MLMRELSRMAILTIIGLVIGIYMIFSESASVGVMLLAPIYLIGMFYAGRTLIGMVGAVVKTYFQCQLMSLFTINI